MRPPAFSRARHAVMVTSNRQRQSALANLTGRKALVGAANFKVMPDGVYALSIPKRTFPCGAAAHPDEWVSTAVERLVDEAGLSTVYTNFKMAICEEAGGESMMGWKSHAISETVTAFAPAFAAGNVRVHYCMKHILTFTKSEHFHWLEFVDMTIAPDPYTPKEEFTGWRKALTFHHPSWSTRLPRGPKLRQRCPSASLATYGYPFESPNSNEAFTVLAMFNASLPAAPSAITAGCQSSTFPR